MKAISGLPVVDSELPDKQEPQPSIVPINSTSSLPVNQSELSVTTAASSLLVDKGELPTEPTPAEPLIASSSLVEISEPQEQTVEHDTSDVQVDQKSGSSSMVDESKPAETTVASSPLVDESRPAEPTTVSSPKVDESRPAETTTVSSPLVDDSESLEGMRGSATVGITTTEVIESDNSLLEQTSASSSSLEQSELLSELPPDNSSPVVQIEPIEASKTPATKRTSKPRSKSISEPPRSKTRRRAK